MGVPTGWNDLTAKESKTKANIKKLEAALARKKAALVRAKGSLSEVERKARVRRLIQLGALVDSVGNFDSAFLLGSLLQAASIPSSSKRWKALKAAGDAFIMERQTKKTKKSCSLP